MFNIDDNNNNNSKDYETVQSYSKTIEILGYDQASVSDSHLTRNRTFAQRDAKKTVCIPHLLAKSSLFFICSFSVVGLHFYGLLCKEIDPLNVSRIRKGRKKGFMRATWLTGKAI